MSHPATANILIRTYQASDQDALAAIIRAAFAAGELSGWEQREIDNMVLGIKADPELTFVALDSGRIVGFLATDYSLIVVAPEARRRGIGRSLVEAAVARQPHVELAPPVGSAIAETFLRAIGFAPHHLLWQLIRSNRERVDEPAAPQGFVLRTYREEDFPLYHQLVNRSFSDHPTPIAVSEARMNAVHQRSDFDPTLIALLAPADARTEPVAFCFVRIQPDDQGIIKGEIGMLGVDRAYRQIGLGRMLLRWGIWRLQTAGCASIDLAVVDSNNRALPLYEREGIHSSQVMAVLGKGFRPNLLTTLH